MLKRGEDGAPGLHMAIQCYTCSHQLAVWKSYKAKEGQQQLGEDLVAMGRWHVRHQLGTS